MELIYIEPSGIWRGLASDLTVDPKLGNKMLNPCNYGGILRDTGDGPYYAMREDGYKKAQRDCFKLFYRNTIRALPLGNNEILRDRTIACNLMLLKFDMRMPETGSMMLRDASPYMAKLMYSENGHITPDEYEVSVFEYALNFTRQVEKLRGEGNLFLMEPDEKDVKKILDGKIPFVLPKIDSLRKFDKYVAKEFFIRGKDYDYICEKVINYSLLPVCLASEMNFEDYVRKIVAEAIFEMKYPARIESNWARKVNEHIKAAWLINPLIDETVPVPCRIVGRVGKKIQVLASDADAELELPYSRDDIYAVEPSWLIILTENQQDIDELVTAGLGSCACI